MLLILFGRQKLNAHISFHVVSGNFLHQRLFRIGFQQFVGLTYSLVLQFSGSNLGGYGEEVIVELNHLASRTVVGCERTKLYLLRTKLLLNCVQQTPVTASPTVYALLHITHKQIV